MISFLNLSYCGFQSEGILYLSQNLRLNSNLLSLNLKGNFIKYKALKALVLNLPSSIVELDLSDNMICDKGAHFISRNVILQEGGYF